MADSLGYAGFPIGLARSAFSRRRAMDLLFAHKTTEKIKYAEIKSISLFDSSPFADTSDWIPGVYVHFASPPLNRPHLLRKLAITHYLTGHGRYWKPTVSASPLDFDRWLLCFSTKSQAYLKMQFQLISFRASNSEKVAHTISASVGSENEATFCAKSLVLW